MADMITRCPSCDTSFRITDAQLQTAKGKVRCGACLHIFKALDNLVTNETPKAAPAPTAPPAPNKPSPPKASATTAASSAPSKSFISGNTGLPAQKSMPRFEYKKPAGNAPSSSPSPDSTKPTAPAPVTTPAPHEYEMDDSYALPENFGDKDVSGNDNLALKNNGPAEDGMENMLRFDQNTIDDSDGDLSEDDMLFNDDTPLDDDEEPVRKIGAYGDDLAESFLDLDAWKPKEKSLFDREIKQPKNNDDDDNAGPDESWAIDLLDDDEDESDRSAFQSKPGNTDNDWMNDSNNSFSANELEELEMDEDDYTRITTGNFNTLSDDDIENALGEGFDDPHSTNDTIDFGEEITQSVSRKPKVREDDTIFDMDNYNAGSDSFGASRDDDDLDDDDDGYYSNEKGNGGGNGNEKSYDEDSYEEEDAYYDPYEEEPEDRGAMLRGIRPEPVEFHFRQERINWKKYLTWGGLITLGVLLLVIQFAWINFESLSRKQPYRDLYATFCPVFGCELPSMAAPNLIRTTNFLVREHPEADDALMVDTILLNTASFKQPFPDLVLTFSNLQGKVVASRRFKPSEYLGGEMAGKSEMPVNQPVHVALEIVNPGPDAVNYSAHIPN